MVLGNHKILTIELVLLIILISSFNNYGQDEVTLYGVIGTFSVNSTEGNVPIGLVMNQTVTVDPGSSVVFKKAILNTDSVLFFLIGPKKSVLISELLNTDPTKSNDNLGWLLLVELVKNGVVPNTVIKTTLSESKIIEILSGSGFKVLPQYPDKKYVLMELDSGTADDTPSPDDAVGEPGNIPIPDDTTAVVIPIPEPVSESLESIIGKWNIIVEGNKYLLEFEAQNNVLSGSIVSTNGSKLVLGELGFSGQIVSFNIPNFPQYPSKFFGNVSNAQPNKIYGIYKRDNNICTWLGEK